MSRFVTTCAAVAAAIAVNFVLFIIIPLLHRAFGTGQPESTSAGRQRIVYEMVRKPEQKEKPQRPRLRSIRQERTDRQPGSSMAFRFSPDLSLDAGGAGEGVALGTRELQAEIFDEGQTDEDPVPVNTPPVAYPERARELGIQGTVEAIFVINYQGRVEDVRIVRSPHPILAAETRKTLMSWRFKPARNKGIPVNIRRKLPIEFTLD